MSVPIHDGTVRVGEGVVVEERLLLRHRGIHSVISGHHRIPFARFVCAVPLSGPLGSVTEFIEGEALQEAADALLEVAKQEYLTQRGLKLMGDDTTVLVVDLLPGGPSTAVAPTNSNCVCS